MKRALPLALLLAVLAFGPALVPSASADEPPAEDSAAARLFRDAWWQETGTGALDQAAAGYREAAKAEGSDGVRARALYRLGLVLERMGRTQEAVAALEGLARAYPGQAELLAESRARLEEWTAEDLRGSFSEWYRRYQYAPAFQAKIVDLVLALGSPDGARSGVARAELLTIGEPALPALVEHAGSANEQLRNAVASLIVGLGRLPPAQHLFEASGWEQAPRFWTIFAAAAGEEREAIAAQARARPTDWRARWILAALGGPEAVLDAIRAAGSGEEQVVLTQLLQMATGETPAPVASGLKAFVTDPAGDARSQGVVASWLIEGFGTPQGRATTLGVTSEDVMAWLAAPSERVRELIQARCGRGDPPAAEVWPEVARGLLTLDPRKPEAQRLVRALHAGLRLAPPDADVEPAVIALVRVLEQGGAAVDSSEVLKREVSRPGSPALPRRVLVEALLRARGERLENWVQAWWDAIEHDEDGLSTLVAFASGAQDPRVRAHAAYLAAINLIDDPAPVMDLLFAEASRGEVADKLLGGLVQHPRLEALAWREDDLRKLVGGIVAGLAPGQHVFQSRLRLMRRLWADDAVRARLMEAAIQSPAQFPSVVWPEVVGLQDSWHPEDAAALLAAFERGWDRWSRTERAAGLRAFLAPWPRAHLPQAELGDFLRKRLSAEGLDATSRILLLQGMADVGLEDVRRCFDLEQPAEVDEATTLLRWLPIDEALYDAFRVALRPGGPWAKAVADHFQPAVPPARAADFAERLLAQPDPELHLRALGVLRARNAARDLPIWIGMLSHESATLRAAAAAALARLYDAEAIRALAKVVDDPDPDVRDAAIAALERIEKVEQEKARWRKFGEGR